MTRSSNRAAAGLARSAGAAAILAIGLPAVGAMAHVERYPICRYYTNTGYFEAECTPRTHPSVIRRWVDIPHQHYTPPTYEPRLPDGY